MEKFVILRSPVVNGEEFAYGTRKFSGENKKDLKVEIAEPTKSEIENLRRDPAVAFAPVMTLKLIEPVARDIQMPARVDQIWGVDAVRADKSPYTGKGVKVAVLDSGVDIGHEAFKGMNIVQKDFTGEGDGDRNGHGTHCAGTIFGQAVNGLRIGLAPGIDQALIGKVIDSRGRGSTDAIVRGIQWALDCGANVISMSLGIDFPGYVKSLVEERGFPVELATSKGLEAYRANTMLFSTLADLAKRRGDFFQATVILAASGNESRRDKKPDFEIAASPPAAAEDVCAVGALEQSPEGLRVAYFSNTRVKVSAPGVNIISAKAGGGLIAMSGTSMATPHAAGVAVLWAEWLLKTVGSIETSALTAKLQASGTYEGFSKPFDLLDVGTGIVQAPQA
jgi:subtilisin family serine protease